MREQQKVAIRVSSNEGIIIGQGGKANALFFVFDDDEGYDFMVKNADKVMLVGDLPTLLKEQLLKISDKVWAMNY